MALITPFDPWKSEYCTCPDKFSLSPYTGCGHNCLYCYACAYIRNFANPRPKKDFLKRLENQIKKIPKSSIVTIANSSDPYQPIEKNLKLTREMLMLLKNYELKINIVTKSILVLRDNDILKDFKNIVLSFTFTTLDNSLAKKIEPIVNCTPKKKLKALGILCKSIPVAVRIDPLIWPLNTSNLKETIKQLKDAGVRQIITSTYKAKPDNLARMKKIFPELAGLWSKLYLLEGEKIGGCFYLAFNLRKKLIEEVREITLAEKLEFSSCREGLAFLNTKSCDGASLFV